MSAATRSASRSRRTTTAGSITCWTSTPPARPTSCATPGKWSRLPAGRYAAIYCSHNLEHYYRHDLPRVLAGFLHVLAPDGFADIRVPDMKAVFEEVLAKDLDIDDVLYESPAGPITVADVVYGFDRKIAETGRDFYAHRNGFMHRSLVRALRTAGFSTVFLGSQPLAFEISALAFKQEPDPEQRALLGLPPPARHSPN